MCKFLGVGVKNSILANKMCHYNLIMFILIRYGGSQDCYSTFGSRAEATKSLFLNSYIVELFK